jgi:hypothetical protein
MCGTKLAALCAPVTRLQEVCVVGVYFKEGEGGSSVALTFFR